MKIKTLVIADPKSTKLKEQLSANISEDLQLFFLVGKLGNISLRKEDFNVEGANFVTYPNAKLHLYEKKLIFKSSDATFNDEIKALLKHFHIHTGDYRPFKWRADAFDGTLLDDFKQLVQRNKRSDVGRYILKIDVFEENLRFLDRKKLKLYLQRAYIRSGFKARKKKSLFTDNFRFQNWSYGIDYVTGNIYEKVLNPEEQLEKLNAELLPLGIKALRLELYSMDTHPAETFEWVFYQITTDFEISKVKAAIETFKASDSYIVKVKTPGMMRDSWVTVQVDAKPLVRDIWAQQVGTTTVIRAITKDNVGLYEILPTLLSTSQKNVKRFPVKRLEYFKKQEEASFDFFDAIDEETGNVIEKTVFDEPISETTEALRLPFEEENLDLGTEFSSEDEEADTLAAASEESSPSASAMSTSQDVTDLKGEGDTLDMSDNDEEETTVDLY